MIGQIIPALGFVGINFQEIVNCLPLVAFEEFWIVLESGGMYGKV